MRRAAIMDRFCFFLLQGMKRSQGGLLREVDDMKTEKQILESVVHTYMGSWMPRNLMMTPSTVYTGYTPEFEDKKGVDSNY